MQIGFVLDALEQAIRHSDRGAQYLSIRYGERLKEAGIEPSVGSVGDACDNALAETVNGLYKTEAIRRQGPWRYLSEVEWATLKWMDWFNNRRLLSTIGDIPPAGAERRFYSELEMIKLAIQDSNKNASDKPGAVQTPSPVYPF